MTSEDRGKRQSDASRAFDLFDEIVDLGPDRRADRLAQIQNDSPGVAAELEALLAADEAADDFLEQPVGDTAVALLGQATERTVGPWRIVDLLGRGGMGVVYRVERSDDQFQQSAALKLVPRALDDDLARRRFIAERQILARLQHPHIAALLDGGVTDEGQPYFAMELAEGPDLIAHCDAEHLDIDHRLGLFLQVCDGVQHAHRNLVVHRDLKPSNIVVTAHGVKLLDFGIAKLIDPDDRAEHLDPNLTRTGTRLLTPSYAAPEQVLGEPITTSTDVYCLGLVLYEMLCGRAAHDLYGAETAAQIEKRICETEVPLASLAFSDPEQSAERAALRRSTSDRLRRRLRGDLDVILRKALAKDPLHRYDSVEALAADIERFLGALPIQARPPSWRYRAGRFVRRNALLVGALSAITALLGTLLLQQVRATREIRSALETSRLEAAKAQETADFLSGLFEVADPTVNSGRDVSARELLDRGANRIRNELGSQPRVQSALMGEIGWIYHRLGLLDEAAVVLGDALAIQDGSSGTDPLERARNQHRLSIVEDHRGNTNESLELARRALALRRDLLPAGHPDIGESMDRLASILAFLGDVEQAEPLAREAVSQLIASVGLEDDRTTTAQHNLAWLLRRIDRTDEAIELYRNILEVDEKRLGPDHPDVQSTRNSLAVTLRRIGRPEEAVPIYLAILESRRRVLGPDHPDVANALHNLARAQTVLADHDEAARNFAEAIDVWSRSLPADHPNFGTVYCSLGDLEALAGRPEQAVERLVHGLSILESKLPPGHARVIDCAVRAAEVSLQVGRPEQAATFSRKALAALTLDEDPPVEQALRRARLEVLTWLATRASEPAAEQAPPDDAMRTLEEHAPEDQVLIRARSAGV